MSQTQSLYRLQQIDTAIQEKKQRLGEVLQAQKETAALTTARERHETAVAAQQQWQTAHKNLNLELDGLNAKSKRSEQRLYSGNVKNPKELTDLQNEIESLGRRRDVLEDEILEAMIMLEEAEAEETAAAAALTQIEAAWEQAQVGLKQEQNELALALHQLMGQRKEQLALITADSLKEYESIRRRKDGIAVAKLRANMCLGCRLTVSAQTEKAARQGQLVYCDSCGRIVVPA